MKRILVVSAILSFVAASFWQTALASPDCGPGYLVGDRKGMVSQSFGATTNATLLPTETIAITSGTSGCSSSGIIYRQYEQEVFVAVNGDSLLQDMAHGQGEYLDAFADLLGCPVELRAVLGGVARRGFEAVSSAGRQEPSGMLAALRGEVKRNKALLAGCTRLS